MKEATPVPQPIQLHEHVQAVFDEYSDNVTLNDYFLLNTPSLIPIAEISEHSELLLPFADPEEFEDDEAGFQAEFDKMRNQFIEEHIQPILDAKGTAASGLTDEQLMTFKLDDYTADEIISDLTELEIPLENMSVWQVVTALRAGIVIADDDESSDIKAYEIIPALGLMLSPGVYVSHSVEEFEKWRVIAQYMMGKVFYESFEAEEVYDEAGLGEINDHMRDLIDRLIHSDEAVGTLYEDIHMNGLQDADQVYQYLPLLAAFEPPAMYPADPEKFSKRLDELLSANKVSWPQLMFAHGGSIFPKRTDILFQFDWFADILEDAIQAIKEKKQSAAKIPYDQVLTVMGVKDVGALGWTTWDEEVLSKMFPKRIGFRTARSENPERDHWDMVSRLANLPYIINHAEMKAFVYKAFQMAEQNALHALGMDVPRIGPRRLDEQSMQQLNREIHAQLQIRELGNQVWVQLHGGELKAIFAEANNPKTMSLEKTEERILLSLEKIAEIDDGGLISASYALMDSLHNDDETG